jgi:hypothetical protein
VSERTAGAGSILSLLTLGEIRRYIRRSHAIAMTVAFTLIYALGSMVLGGMLVFAHLSGGYQVIAVWGNALGTSSWSYPGLLILAPWGIVTLPFFATFAMVVVSIGVGIGMSVAILLGVSILRYRRSAAGRPASVGSLAGLTPAMIALVTLGACCSTTAAATAGVGLVAQVSGSTPDNLLLNNWYLGVFQIAVVWIALIAQEIVLRVYGGLLGGPTRTGDAVPTAPRIDRRFALGSAFRAALLVGGITWSLAMLVEWTSVDPLGASGAVWFRWLFEHQLPAFLAIFTALFPAGTAAFFRLDRPSRARGVLRSLLALGGASLVLGAPMPFAGWGVEGFLNELFATLGMPAAWGGVAPVFPPGLDLYFRWGFQYLLLGGFALVVAIWPALAFRPLGWTVAVREAPDSSRRSPAPPSPASTRLPRGTTASAIGPVPDGPPATGAVAEGP